MAVTINRRTLLFKPDPKRVIARFFSLGPERSKKVISRILSLSEDDTLQTLNQTLRDFSERHRNISRIFTRHFHCVESLIHEVGTDPETLTQERRLLIGAYFTHEYSIESAAFFNPSMVEDPDQANLEEGQKRVIVSFRATGEGHVSSIAFRGGIIDKNNHLEFKTPGRLVDEAETIQRHVYHKEDFIKKLTEMDVHKPEVIKLVMDKLGDSFIYGELQGAITAARQEIDPTFTKDKVFETINWLASSHYEITFSMDTAISDRVIFPIASTESNGIEDARFVRFTDDDGTIKYYATYTAYNGYSILPKLIVTNDFYRFKIMPINGQSAQNKGMALFPRKINGKFAMLSRHDGENNYIMFSDNVNYWEDVAVKVQDPHYPWEFIQLGNSGSPIETDYGWLVVTHGVGTMRRYVLGAILLDLDDPRKVIGHLSEPLLIPNEQEREGYVPNVVYSCGSIINNDELIIPYAMSDYCSGFASVSLKELFEKMLPGKGAYLKNGKKKKHINNILLVDDDKITQRLATHILKSAGYHVVIAKDGLDALMEISKQPFDLIISDVEMPNLTGFQLLEFLNERNYEIPVVFLTTHTNRESEMHGLKLGAVEYFKKPIDGEMMLLRLKKLFAE
ncbi:MAG: response regulator [Bacteroidetes bacterium]|nr:response regulator [Bacteroidota bacterium]